MMKRIPYKKLQELFERQSQYNIKMGDINKQVDAILHNTFGEEIAEMILSDVDFQDSILAYACNGEVQPLETMKMYLQEAFEKANANLSLIKEDIVDED